MPLISAHVLTYRSPTSLLRCLDSIDAQTAPVSEIVVVDNDGGETVEQVLAGRVARTPVRLVALDENMGPAGGHAAGLREFVAGPCDWAWVMDDDVVIDPGGLASMLAAAGDADSTFVSPLCRDAETGEKWDNSNAWLGELIPRRAVEEVGGPDPDLFWWTEDTEYLQWRLPRAGFERVEPSNPVVTVSRSRTSDSKPAWKYYYETRNQIHYRMRIQGPEEGETVPRHLTRRVRTWRAVRATTKLALRATLRESGGRIKRLAMVGRGAVDGVRGRSGRRFAPVEPDRPDVEPMGPGVPDATIDGGDEAVHVVGPT